MFKYLVEVALADRTGETAVVDVADIIVEDTVGQSAGDAVVGTEIFALERIAEVRWIVFVPFPVAPVVERGAEVYVTISQFGEHGGQHLEELFVVEVTFRAYIIYIIYLLPVETVFMLFVVEEAVVFVDDMP